MVALRRGRNTTKTTARAVKRSREGQRSKVRRSCPWSHEAASIIRSLGSQRKPRSENFLCLSWPGGTLAVGLPLLQGPGSGPAARRPPEGRWALWATRSLHGRWAGVENPWFLAFPHRSSSQPIWTSRYCPGGDWSETASLLTNSLQPKSGEESSPRKHPNEASSTVSRPRNIALRTVSSRGRFFWPGLSAIRVMLAVAPNRLPRVQPSS